MNGASPSSILYRSSRRASFRKGCPAAEHDAASSQPADQTAGGRSRSYASERTKRFVELTAAGEIFLNHCRMALMQIGQGIELAQRTARGEQGLLVIGFVGSATYEFLPPIVREYRKNSHL